jgi:hypothetical protein
LKETNNLLGDFYDNYNNEEKKKSCIETAQAYLNQNLNEFRKRMFQNLFSGSDELEMVDTLMKYYKCIPDAHKFIEAACEFIINQCNKIVGERKDPSQKDKVDRKLADLWYSLGRVYHSKGDSKEALVHL